MVIDHSREKLIHAINFFARNTQFCGKTKLFKLLYFLDFEHFKLTGRSVTGLEYFAWPKGPVPKALQDEIAEPGQDMRAHVIFKEKRTAKGNMVVPTPVGRFNDSVFTKRELSLLESLALRHRDDLADDMIEATHLENLPWDKVYNKEGRKQQLIPYELAIRTQELDEVVAIAASSREIRENYR
jgi:uncharacterized phage-associated protein